MLETSSFEKQKLANSIFGGAVYPKASSFELKMFSDTVSLLGIGTEITTDGYEAIEFDNDTVTFPALTDGTAANAVVLQTDVFTEDSPEIVSVGIFDQLGNLRYRKVYSAPFQILSGQFFELAVGELSLEIS